MPQAIPMLLYYAAAFTAGGSILASAVAFAGSLIVNAYQARAARRKARDEWNASLRDRLVMVSTADAARTRCYGRVRNVDGVLFKGTYGATSEYFMMVVALAGHECDAIEDVYAVDVKLTLGAPDGDGWYPVVSAPYLVVGKGSRTATCTVAGGTGTVVLPETPVPGTVVATYSDTTVWDDQKHEQLTPSVSGNTVTITGASYAGTYSISYQSQIEASQLHVKKFLGAPGQDLHAVLQPNFPTLITSAHKFSGMTCLVARLKYNQDAYPNGVPQISAVIRGAKVYDERTGVTAWSQNPSLIARDWALYAFGGRATSAEIDSTSFIAAANACDITHGFVTPSGTQTLPLYTCGIVCKTNADPWAQLGSIVESMAGKHGWAGGKLRVRAGAYSAPVPLTITESWLRGAEPKTEGGIVSAGGNASLKVSPAPGRADLVNIMRPTISDAAQNYLPVQAPELRVPSWITADGAEYPIEVDLAGVTDAIHAQHVCGVRMREARNSLTCELPCNMLAYQLELFDVVPVTLPRLGWADKLMEVIGWRWTYGAGINLVLKETAAAIYDPDTAFSETDLTPNTALPSAFNVPVPSNINTASGTAQLLRQVDGTVVSRIKVTWDESPSESVRNSGAIEVRWGLASADESTWQTIELPGDSTQVYLDGVNDLAFYLIKLRARNGLKVRSDWSVHNLVQVIGKSEAASAVAGFAHAVQVGGVKFTWTPCADLDYEETELRVGATWSTATRIFKGQANTYLWPMPAAGSYIIQARHRDTSGNESAASASLVVTFASGDLRDPANVNFEGRNDRNGSAISAPTIATNGTAVDHVIKADGSADVSFEWSWGGAEVDIDGFEVLLYTAGSSGSYTIGSTPAAEQVMVVPASKRAVIVNGINANTYITWGVRAFRVVDPDINATGKIFSAWVKPSIAAEDPYQPASSVAFAGDVTGTVGGVAAANAATWQAASANFNSRNDRLGTALVVPTVAGDGTAVDHVINTDGSADVSFEWSWGGTESEIDGFQVLLYSSTSSSAYTIGSTPSAETVHEVPASKRAMLAYGLNPTTYLTWAVRAYRVVDPDINAAGVIYSAWVKSTASGENPYRPASSVAFAGDVTGTVGGVAAANAATWQAASVNFNSRNDRLGTALVVPTVAGDGTAVDHVINTDGSADVSFEWSWGGTESDIDGFQVLLYSSTSSSAYTIGSTPSAETVHEVPASKRAMLAYGLNPTTYLTWAVRAYRVVDPDINAAGVIYSAWVKSTASGENPYRPASSVAFAGDVTGTVGGVAAANAATWQTAVTNFNARNDRNAAAVVAPTIATDGTAVDHAINGNASADVSFEWSWGGTESDIDGFQVLLYSSSSSSAYTIGTTPAAETILQVPANKRAFIALGLNPTNYITWGVRAFRVVDPDINAAGVIYSAWVKPSAAGENPYRPASTLAYAGDVTGTVGGIPASNVNVWSAITGVSVTTGQVAADNINARYRIADTTGVSYSNIT